MDFLTTNFSRFIIRALFHVALLFCLSFNINAKETALKALPENPAWQGSLTDEELQEAMKTYLGIEYKYGGATKNGFDCSGFVKKVYGKYFSIDLPHQSSQQASSPLFTNVPLDNLKTGDLIFFSIHSKKKAINHVGIYLSDGEFIHAGRSTGVVVSSLNTTYWRSKVVRAKRMSSRNEDNPGTIFMDMDLMFTMEESKSSLFQKPEFLLSSDRMLKGFSPDIGDIFKSMEFGYSKTFLSGLTSSLSVFREPFIFTEKGVMYTSNKNSHDLSEESIYTQGLTLSGSLNIFKNSSLIPSLSYMDYSSNANIDNLPRLSLDLKYRLFSSSDKWSMTGGVHMPIQSYSSIGGAVDDSIGLSISYQQKFSENMFFIFSGRNYINANPGLKDSTETDKENNNFSFMFKIFY